jgi:putative addiction module component (TIGR02574 family)
MDMKPINLSEVLALPVPDRLKLIEAIWDSITEVPEALDLTATQQAEIDRRLDAFLRDPAAGSPWPEVKARILKQS